MFGFFKKKTNVGDGYIYNEFYNSKIEDFLDEIEVEMKFLIDGSRGYVNGSGKYYFRNNLDTLTIYKNGNKITFNVPEYTFIGCGSLQDDNGYKFVPSIYNANRMIKIKNKIMEEIENKKKATEKRRKIDFLNKVFSFEEEKYDD